MLVHDALYRKIKKQVGQAIGDFNLIESGDRIAVAVSGGKDSYTLLHILDALRRRSPVRYELVAVNVDAGFPGYRKELLAAHLAEHGFTARRRHLDEFLTREQVSGCTHGVVSDRAGQAEHQDEVSLHFPSMTQW